MTNNEMPDEIYASHSLTNQYWTRDEHPALGEQTKYIRADLTQPAGDVGEALDKLLGYTKRNDDNKFRYFDKIDAAAETIRRALSQQPDAKLLAALEIVEAVICHEVCSSTNKQIADSGELCRSDISKIRRFISQHMDLEALKLKQYNDFKQRVALEQEEDDDSGKRAEQKGGE